MTPQLKTYHWLLIAMILSLAILFIGDWTASVYHLYLVNGLIYWLLYAIIGLPSFYFTCRR